MSYQTAHRQTGCQSCDHCGGRAQPETVIRLRRTLAGLREERAEGWYCWSCKASGVVAPRAAFTAPPSAAARPLPTRPLPTRPAPARAPDMMPGWLIGAFSGLGMRRPRAC